MIEGLVTPGFVGGAEAFPKDSELACGVAGRVASCVAGVLGHRYGQDETNPATDCSAEWGEKEEERRKCLQQTLGDYRNLTIFRGQVSSDTVRIDCLKITGRPSFVAHM